jgi:transposase
MPFGRLLISLPRLNSAAHRYKTVAMKTTLQNSSTTQKPKPKRSRGTTKTNPVSKDIVNPNAAAIDIAVKGDLWACVNPESCPQRPIRPFSPMTCGVLQMINWFKQCGVDTVVMEATGSYWMTLYILCREAGLSVCLANPRAVKGYARKSDMNDCQWLWFLHARGLVKASFVPETQELRVRTISRQRDELVRESARYVQLMQKALDELNIHLHHVISDLTGVTGLAIIEAILNGERDPKVLASLRNKRIAASEQKIIESLNGRWDQEQIFVLGQNYESWKHKRAQIEECDKALLAILGQFVPKLDEKELAQAKDKLQKKGLKRRTGPSANAVPDEWKDHLHRLFGVDLTQVPGIGVLAAFTLWSEIGVDWKNKFPTLGQFVSWLALCPNHEVSGGKILKRHTRVVQNRLRNLMKCCAQSLASNHSILGDQYRRMRGRLGPAQANTAMAHKLARIVWHMVTTQENYDESVLAAYEKEQLARDAKRLQKRATKMGYKLVKIEETPPDQPMPIAA